MLFAAILKRFLYVVFGVSSINRDNNCLQYMDCPVIFIQNKSVNNREKRDNSKGIINLLLIILQKYISAIIKGIVNI